MPAHVSGELTVTLDTEAEYDDAYAILSSPDHSPGMSIVSGDRSSLTITVGMSLSSPVPTETT